MIGDVYINTGTGTVASGWTGIVGDSATDGQRVVFDGSNWALIGQSAGGGVQTVTGAPLSLPLVHLKMLLLVLATSTDAAFGSSRLAVDPPNGGDLISTADTDVLSVPHFNELASRITTASGGGVQTVTGDNGVTASGTSDITVSGVTATTAQIGVTTLSNAVATVTTKALTPRGCQLYAVPLDLSSLDELP